MTKPVATPDKILTSPAASTRTEILVAGAGIVGLTLGIALARQGLRVIVAGKIDARLPGRTVALLNGSIDFLDAIGLWRELALLSEPLRVMRIVDDTGSVFQAPPVAFEANEIGEMAFGHNIRNADLVARLAEAASRQPALTLIDRHLVSFEFGADEVVVLADDGQRIVTQLVAASDGRRSAARQAAGVPIKSWTYPQHAITAILRHERPHRGVSTEFHTRQGPFTLVPLPAEPDAPHRSSLVWVVEPARAEALAQAAPERLAGEIERQSRMILGRIRVEGDTGSFPITGLVADALTAPRMVLAGEAAHVFPPIGAQGLNLGLRDVAALAGLLATAKRQGADLGAPALLDRYARERRGDVALRTMGVDRLNRSLLSGLLPVDMLRVAGLQALAHIGPLRRLAMRAGLGARS